MEFSSSTRWGRKNVKPQLKSDKSNLTKSRKNEWISCANLISCCLNASNIYRNGWTRHPIVGMTSNLNNILYWCLLLDPTIYFGTNKWDSCNTILTMRDIGHHMARTVSSASDGNTSPISCTEFLKWWLVFANVVIHSEFSQHEPTRVPHRPFGCGG